MEGGSSIFRDTQWTERINQHLKAWTKHLNSSGQGNLLLSCIGGNWLLCQAVFPPTDLITRLRRWPLTLTVKPGWPHFPIENPKGCLQRLCPAAQSIPASVRLKNIVSLADIAHQEPKTWVSKKPKGFITDNLSHMMTSSSDKVFGFFLVFSLWHYSNDTIVVSTYLRVKS